MRSDEELMAAYVEGDATAFRTLFDRYAPLLQRVFLRRMRTPELARDLVQQTFLQLHRARNDFRPDALVRPWLMTIAMNLFREHYRRSARRPESLIDPVGALEPRESPHGQERSDIRRDLAGALAKLPEDQREVVMLHWFDGLSFPEIAEMVGATPGAVRVRAHRAYATLRELLEDDRNGSGLSDVREGKP